jgi:hypothetical protein
VAAGAAAIDRFLPFHDVREVHERRVAAAAPLAFATALDLRLGDSPLMRLLVGLRELVLSRGRRRRSRLLYPPTPRGLIAEVTALGWEVLAVVPGREIVFGAVCKPWKADPGFSPLRPDRFTAFAHPGFAKIAWSIEVEELDAGLCLVRTQTRVALTDEVSRRRFRRYWRRVVPGVRLLRRDWLRALRKAAEERAPSYRAPMTAPH